MERTVKYLARYADRIANANSRVISCHQGEVKYYFNDYRNSRTEDTKGRCAFRPASPQAAVAR
jgi:hypothetical protein